MLSGDASERRFKVLGYLHMGLGVKVGQTYAESDLRRRCKGDGKKLRRVQELLCDPTGPVSWSLACVSGPNCVRDLAGPVFLDRPQLGPGMRTYVINLKRRPDRRGHIERVCKALALEPEFIDAV